MERRAGLHVSMNGTYSGLTNCFSLIRKCEVFICDSNAILYQLIDEHPWFRARRFVGLMSYCERIGSMK